MVSLCGKSSCAMLRFLSTTSCTRYGRWNHRSAVISNTHGWARCLFSAPGPSLSPFLFLLLLSRSHRHGWSRSGVGASGGSSHGKQQRAPGGELLGVGAARSQRRAHLRGSSGPLPAASSSKGAATRTTSSPRVGHRWERRRRRQAHGRIGELPISVFLFFRYLSTQFFLQNFFVLYF
jgi:hypothetical protein